MKKYRTGGYLSATLIEELEIVKETRHQVVVAYPYKDRNGTAGTREVREAKISGNLILHDTYEESLAHLVKKAATGVRCAMGSLERARDFQETVSKLATSR